MNHIVVAIFDKKTASYDRPVICKHPGEAVRDFDHLRKDKDTRLGKNPEDFDLFQIAVYDDVTAQFVEQKPIHLASGV